MKFKRTLRFFCTCEKCGVEFKSFKKETRFCDTHRWLGRKDLLPPLIERDRKCRFCGVIFKGRHVPVEKGVFCSIECYRQNKATKKREMRRSKGIMPVQPKQIKVIPKIEPLRKMDKVKPEPTPIILISPPVYKTVRINAKTVIEFRSKERYEKYLSSQINDNS